MPAEAAFVILAAIALGGALAAVTSSSLFRAALGLMLSLLGTAGLFLLQKSEFIAVVQVLVYVGGVAVLIIFAVMLTERVAEPLMSGLRPLAWIGATVALLLSLALGWTLWRSPLSESPPSSVTARDLGLAFLNEYLVPFEAVSLLLLVALIGAVIIAKGKE